MSGPNIRMTAVIWDILDVLIHAPGDDPAWGLRICEQTGYGTGTIYPALDRMLNAGYIRDHWEDPPPENRPKRRYYELTASGRQWMADAVRARSERRATWVHPLLRPGS
jgi:PadR family transcriptional regulator, regulatory protein PadR